MEFHVPDMTCGHCKAAIEEAVQAAGGTVTVDLPAKRVCVEGLEEGTAAQVLRTAGYSPEAVAG